MQQNRKIFISLMVLVVFSLVLAFYGLASNVKYNINGPARKTVDTAQTDAIPANPAAPGSNVFETEPNNTPQQAQVLTGVSPIVVSGNAEVNDQGTVKINFSDGTSDDIEDLYKVTILQPGLKLNLGNFTSDCDLYLLDEGVTRILHSSNYIGATKPEEIDNPALAAGTYLIAVTIFDPDPAGAPTTPYTLTVTGNFSGQDDSPFPPPLNLRATVIGGSIRLDWDAPSGGPGGGEAELKFDDGTFENNLGFCGGTGTVANGPFMPPSSPAKIKSVKFVTNGRRSGDQVKVRIYIDPSGRATQPSGNILVGTKGPLYLGPGNVFQEVDVTDLNLSVGTGRLFVGVEQLNTENFGLGLDTNAPDGNAFYGAATGNFNPLINSNFHGAFGIRVVVILGGMEMEMSPIALPVNAMANTDEVRAPEVAPGAAPFTAEPGTCIMLDGSREKDEIITAETDAEPFNPAGPTIKFDEIEPNNTPETAQPIHGPATIGVYGNCEKSDRGSIYYSGADDIEDLYKITIVSPGIDIKMQGHQTDLDIFLLTEDGTRVIERSYTVSENERIRNRFLDPGTYLIGVSVWEYTWRPPTSYYGMSIECDSPPPGQQGVESYNVYRSIYSPVLVNDFNKLVNVPGTTLTYTDARLAYGQTYYYVVTAVYRNGESGPSNEVSGRVGLNNQMLKDPFQNPMAAEKKNLPQQYDLIQNFPNPFNPKTEIKFALPEDSHVKITIYSTLGEKVAELIDQDYTAGFHQVDFNATGLASGVYFYVMETANFKDIKRMVFLK